MMRVLKIGVGSQIGAGLSGYIAELIPQMLAAFLASDRGFAKARRKRGNEIENSDGGRR